LYLSKAIVLASRVVSFVTSFTVLVMMYPKNWTGS
jgi:hypothetical protein